MKALGIILMACIFLFGFSNEDTEDVIIGQRLVIKSRHLGESRTIYLRLPKKYEESAKPYPVLYILDGGDYFVPFAGMVQYMNYFDMMPEMIIAAIAQGDRLKEFTFTKSNDWPTSGGAETFRKFLAEELIPYIDGNYRTHPFRILIGHSLGGLFAVEALVRSPKLFQATLALSPSLYWDQFKWLKNADSMFDGISSWKHFLFISCEPKDEEQTGYLNQFRNLAETDAPKDFFYKYKLYPEENHGSIAFPALYHCFKELYQGLPFPGEAWEEGPEKVKAHFRALTDRFGYKFPIPEEFLVDHAAHGLQRHEAPDEAIKLLELCLTLYPEAASAYEGLGEAYEWKGELEEAIKFYRRSLEIDPNFTIVKEKMEALAIEQQKSVENWEKQTFLKQPPEKVMDAAGIKPGMIIGEVGAGRGRFTMHLARRVRTEGKILANDIDAEGLAFLTERCQRAGIHNVEIVHGEVDDPHFPKGALDMVFMVWTYHFFDQPITMLKKLLPSLKPGGTIVLVEPDPKRGPGGSDHGISPERMRRDAAQAGFEVVRIEDFLSEDLIFILRIQEHIFSP